MKTKILVITAMLFAGLILISCQKDNSFADETSVSVNKAGPIGVNDDLGQWTDPITNYPDPFERGTIILYQVKSDTRVSLVILDKNLDWVDTLVDDFQTAGSHMVKYDGSKLPAGTYIARLKVGSDVYNEPMTKKSHFQDDNHHPDETEITD